MLQRTKEGLMSQKQQLSAPFVALWRSLLSVFSSTLRLTTGLLLFIWFANALTYYAEVLLTVTVRLPTVLPAEFLLLTCFCCV